MSRQAEQNQYWHDRGFRCVEICEVPKWTDDDEKARQNLIREVMASSCERLKAVLTPFYRGSVYTGLCRECEAMLQFVQERAAAMLDAWPDEEFFRKVDLHCIYEATIDFIISDGGEIREDKAFEDDGETAKEGWIAVYWK